MQFLDKFGFFDPTQPYTVTYGELPHWEQVGATSFITFRASDSLPAAVIQLWERERDDWLRLHGIEPAHENWRVALQSRPHALQRTFHRLFATKLEQALDECHGECVLRQPELAQIVADSLLHFDGRTVAGALRDPAEPGAVSRSDTATSATSSPIQPREVRYHVSDFVIMPNHVHVMVCFLEGTPMRDQCYSWKHFTAVKIHKLLGRTGEFWQTESFDHLVRDADHFHRFRKYIAENPAKAGLKPHQATHYQCPMK